MRSLHNRSSGVSNAAKHIEVIARGLWVRDGKLLVCRNVKHGHCYLPGGHVEAGEPATEALRREFVEETGEDVTVGALCIVAEQLFSQRGTPRHELSFVFHVEHSGEPGHDVRSLEPGIRFEWLGVGELLSAGFLPKALIEPLEREVQVRSRVETLPLPHPPQVPAVAWIPHEA